MNPVPPTSDLLLLEMFATRDNRIEELRDALSRIDARLDALEALPPASLSFEMALRRELTAQDKRMEALLRAHDEQLQALLRAQRQP